MTSPKPIAPDGAMEHSSNASPRHAMALQPDQPMAGIS
jgi:hypothetical protein